jgi:hypothetical protein
MKPTYQSFDFTTQGIKSSSRWIMSMFGMAIVLRIGRPGKLEAALEPYERLKRITQ